MARSFTSASFSFSSTNAELALLQEAFQAVADLHHDVEPAPPSPAMLAIFPPARTDDAWCAFKALFGEPSLPFLGAEISGGASLESPGASEVLISGTHDFRPEPIARLIHACCQQTLKSTPIGFEWAATCSVSSPGEFGGGWCAIFLDRIEYGSTGQVLSSALADGID